MKDKLAKLAAKMKDISAKVSVKTKDICAKLSVKMKAFAVWAKNYILSLRADRSKLILTIILAIAILLSCVAVITFAGKVVNGVSGIFSGDEDKANEPAPLPLKERAEGEEPCTDCDKGYCLHCTGGTLACPDCETGVCSACNGTKGNQSKFLSMLIDNCLSCNGTGVCKTCEGTHVIDCEYCTDGKCNNCVAQ